MHIDFWEFIAAKFKLNSKFVQLFCLNKKNKNLYSLYQKVSKVGDLCWGWPVGTLFNSYHTKV